MSASVRAHGILHGLVFLDGGLGKLQTEAQGIGDISVCVVWRFLDELGDFLFAEGFHFQSLIGEPVLHLGHTVGVIQAGEALHGGHEGGFGFLIEGDGIVHQLRIQADAAVIDFLIEMIFFPDEVRNREAGEALFDSKFYFHVTAVIFLEADPFFSVMLGQVSGSAIVCLGGLAGAAEVFDEVFSFF